VPPECRVFIGGVIAAQLPDGAWIAPGWEIPGEHLVDVVPGPSRTYTVLPDPGGSHESWTLADALAAPTTAAQRPPAALAIIAGARVCAPGAQTILATDSSPTVIALGARANQRPVSPRPGLPAAVALLPFEPAFLVVSSGRRRKEGKVIWLGNAMAGQPARMGKVPDLRWISTVLGAAARRLPVNPDSESAKTAWRSAVAAARRAQRHSS
jgi:hypothetical protein